MTLQKYDVAKVIHANFASARLQATKWNRTRYQPHEPWPDVPCPCPWCLCTSVMVRYVALGNKLGLPNLAIAIATGAMLWRHLYQEVWGNKKSASSRKWTQQARFRDMCGGYTHWWADGFKPTPRNAEVHWNYMNISFFPFCTWHRTPLLALLVFFAFFFKVFSSRAKLG